MKFTFVFQTATAAGDHGIAAVVFFFFLFVNSKLRITITLRLSYCFVISGPPVYKARYRYGAGR